MVAFRVLVLVELKQLLKSTSFTLNPPGLQSAGVTNQTIGGHEPAHAPDLHVERLYAIWTPHRSVWVIDW